MRVSGGWQKRWGLALFGMALGVATSGCSFLIAKSGVSSVHEIYTPQTRAEVRTAFGEADETGTCPDGRPVERRAIRRQLPDSPADCKSGCRILAEALARAYIGSLGLVDVVVFPFALYASERAKLHYVFVYGEDDRVLYRYDVTAAPSDRYVGAVSPLFGSLSRQLNEAGCPSRGPCLNALAAEVRQRAVCVDYPLTPEEEDTLHLVQTLAADVDAGRLAPDDTLAELQWCLGIAPISCLLP